MIKKLLFLIKNTLFVDVFLHVLGIIFTLVGIGAGFCSSDFTFNEKIFYILLNVFWLICFCIDLVVTFILDSRKRIEKKLDIIYGKHIDANDNIGK